MKNTYKDVPKKVLIGIHTYTISFHKDLKSETGDDMYGACYKALKQIKLSLDYTSHKVSETLLHELLHAIWYEYNIPDKTPEEKAVHMISYGFTKMMMDNPKLKTYFNKEWSVK